jgi:hypothetical protein
MRISMVGLLAFVSTTTLGIPLALAGKHSIADTIPLNIASDGYVDTPSGRMHSSCVHRVPKGAHLQHGSIFDEDGSLIVKPDGRCRFPIIHDQHPAAITSNGILPDSASLFGYVETRDGSSVYSTAGVDFFDGLEANVVVPANPTSIVNSSNPMLSQLIYLFPAYEDASLEAIIQPVLQWGDGASGGGNYWGISAWYIDDAQQEYISYLEEVYAGDTINMSMYGDSCSSGSCYWQIELDDNTTGPVSTYLSTGAAEVMKFATASALECKRVTACNQLPNSGGITFTGEHFYEPGYLGGPFDQDETASITWGSSWTGSGSSPLCGWGQSGVTSNSSSLSW